MRPGRELRMPGLAGADSRLVVPVMSLGQLVGVVVADSTRPAAFGADEEHVLGVVATMLGTAIEHVRALERQPDEPPRAPPRTAARRTGGRRRRSCASSTSTAARSSTASTSSRESPAASCGRCWASTPATGRVDFTNRELRLDASLQLPGFKDNLESRLILLKRRLDEREAPVRLERTGRGRFRLDVATPVRLECEA